MDLKDQILEIAEQLKSNEITTDYAKNLLLRLFEISDNWTYVSDETPPNDIELLAKSPNGIVHLTYWRPAYDIFTCQCKSESTSYW